MSDFQDFLVDSPWPTSSVGSPPTTPGSGIIQLSKRTASPSSQSDRSSKRTCPPGSEESETQGPSPTTTQPIVYITGNNTVVFHCPFSFPRPGYRPCTALGDGRKTIKAINRHLREIRFPDDGITPPFDEFHQESDPLWSKERVQQLLKKRVNLTPAQEAEKKREHNQKYYRRKREEWEKKRVEFQADVAAGKITRIEANQKLGSFQIGWFRYRTKLQELQDQLAAATAGNSGGSNDEIESLKRRLEEESKKKEQNESNSLFFNALKGLFRDKSAANNGLPAIPNGSSRQDYLAFLAHFLPMSLWNDEPIHNISIDIVHGILSSDQKFSYYNHIGEWFDEEEKSRLLQNYNKSVDEARAYWRTASRTEKEEFRQEWVTVREEMRRTFFPVNNFSCAVFHRLLDSVYKLLDENSEEGEPAPED